MFFTKRTCFLLLFLFINCRNNPPCSPLDSSCTPLGYLIPHFFTNQTDRFAISAIAGPKSITISWAQQQGVPTYKIYAKSTPGVTNKDPEITNGGTNSTNFTELVYPSNSLL